MAYVSVKKNDKGEWEIFKYLTSVINQVSPVSGYTIGNVTELDAAQRLFHGFWILNDVYVGNGEFMEFDKKETKMDNIECIVTNTYTYKRMNLDYVREEMKNRVRNHRAQLSQSYFIKGDNEFDLSIDGRTELQGKAIEVLLNPAIEHVRFRLPDGRDISLTADEVKSLNLEIAAYRDGLYDKEADLINAIGMAETYEDIRAVSKWGEQLL